MKVCIDAGHGGHDPGAVGPCGLKEAHVNLDIAERLSKLLLPTHSFLLTRPKEVYVGLSARCDIANDWDADIFVSIHCNSDGPTAVGIETLYKTEKGKALATPIQKELIRVTGDVDRGLKCRTDLAVLNGTAMPAVLVEVGFISHPATEAKLATEDYRSVLAKAIVDGITHHHQRAPA